MFLGIVCSWDVIRWCFHFSVALMSLESRHAFLLCKEISSKSLMFSAPWMRPRGVPPCFFVARKEWKNRVRAPPLNRPHWVNCHFLKPFVLQRNRDWLTSSKPASVFRLSVPRCAADVHDCLPLELADASHSTVAHSVLLAGLWC